MQHTVQSAYILTKSVQDPPSGRDIKENKRCMDEWGEQLREEARGSEEAAMDKQEVAKAEEQAWKEAAHLIIGAAPSYITD